MRGAARVILQHHRILRLPRKMTLQNFAQISRKQLMLHPPRKVTLELHQVLHLPRKITLMIDPDH